LTGHYYFTKCLLPALISTAQSEYNPQKKVRVINVSSFAHMVSPEIDLDAIEEDPVAVRKGIARQKYTVGELYQMSKLVCDSLPSYSTDRGVMQ
jgi:retinol dehydrogenase 12